MSGWKILQMLILGIQWMVINDPMFGAKKFIRTTLQNQSQIVHGLRRNNEGVINVVIFGGKAHKLTWTIR
jgi:hypothetical protein